MAQRPVISMGDASSEIDYRIPSNSELIQKLSRSMMNSKAVLEPCLNLPTHPLDGTRSPVLAYGRGAPFPTVPPNTHNSAAPGLHSRGKNQLPVVDEDGWPADKA